MTVTELWRIAIGQLNDLTSSDAAPAAVALTQQLFDQISSTHTPPKSVERGHWPTVIVSWPDVSLEVFGAEIEVYPNHDPLKVLTFDGPTAEVLRFIPARDESPS